MQLERGRVQESPVPSACQNYPRAQATVHHRQIRGFQDQGCINRSRSQATTNVSSKGMPSRAVYLPLIGTNLSAPKEMGNDDGVEQRPHQGRVAVFNLELKCLSFEGGCEPHERLIVLHEAAGSLLCDVYSLRMELTGQHTRAYENRQALFCMQIPTSHFSEQKCKVCPVQTPRGVSEQVVRSPQGLEMPGPRTSCLDSI